MEEIYELVGFTVTNTFNQNGTQIIEAQRKQTSAICPVCQQQSSRIHSYYYRKPQDLPISDKNVILILRMRRFRCINKNCTRSTFSEEYPQVITKYSRKTNRLKQALIGIAFESGGEAGARLAKKLHMKVSADTLLRLIREYSIEKKETIKALGIDDFAFRKGIKYGTILVDLENHKPIDLLPDRSSQTVATWLKDHPEIEIVTRDRSMEYARGVSEGLPYGIQITDRWHLLQNLRDALERMLNGFHTKIKALPINNDLLEAHHAEIMKNYSRKLSPAEVKLQEAKRQRRYELYQKIQDLHRKNTPVLTIAQQLSLSRTTVYRFIAAKSFPERASKVKSLSILGPYLTYLQQRFDEGCENANQLFREIQAKGFIGSHKQVSRWVQYRRTKPAKSTPKKHVQNPFSKSQMQVIIPAPRRLVWLLVKESRKLSHYEQLLLKHLFQNPEIENAYELAQQFQKMVREHESEKFDIWIEQCLQCSTIDLVNFAKGLQRDHDPVFMAVHSKWSNGQTEGQVTRLKLIKRKMYGRANFDLLRQRVLFSDTS